MNKKNSIGRVFQRIYRDRKGNLQRTSTWFLKYRTGNKLITIPTGTQDYQEAVAILWQKVDAATHLWRFDMGERVAVNQLLDLVIEDYRSKDRSTAYDMGRGLAKHLRPFFGAKEPIDVTAALLEQYVMSRRRDKAAAATVNKELAYLRRAFRLGYRHEPQLVSKCDPSHAHVANSQKLHPRLWPALTGASQSAAIGGVRHGARQK